MIAVMHMKLILIYVYYVRMYNEMKKLWKVITISKNKTSLLVAFSNALQHLYYFLHIAIHMPISQWPSLERVHRPIYPQQQHYAWYNMHMMIPYNMHPLKRRVYKLVKEVCLAPSQEWPTLGCKYWTKVFYYFKMLLMQMPGWFLYLKNGNVSHILGPVYDLCQIVLNVLNYLATFAWVHPVVKSWSLISTHSTQNCCSVKFWKNWEKRQKLATFKDNTLMTFIYISPPQIM